MDYLLHSCIIYLVCSLFVQAYNSKLSDELKGTSMATSFETIAPKATLTDITGDEASPHTSKDKNTASEPEAQGVDKDEDAGVDLDFNLVQNLLASYNAQGGLPGPISNLVGMMGLELPDDAPPAAS